MVNYEDKDLRSKYSLAEKYGDEVSDASVMDNMYSIAQKPLYSNRKVLHLQFVKGSWLRQVLDLQLLEELTRRLEYLCKVYFLMVKLTMPSSQDWKKVDEWKTEYQDRVVTRLVKIMDY